MNADTALTLAIANARLLIDMADIRQHLHVDTLYYIYTMPCLASLKMLINDIDQRNDDGTYPIGNDRHAMELRQEIRSCMKVLQQQEDEANRAYAEAMYEIEMRDLNNEAMWLDNL
jgi:hypothetical protein